MEKNDIFIFIYTINKYKYMKINRNYTIEKTIDEDFTLLTKELTINKSQFVEKKIKEFIDKNKDLLLNLKNNNVNKNDNI